jgi:enamine deaminase RidA (YjgF/YER057c/UK114 family)
VPFVAGKLGRELSIAEGAKAARLAGLCCLSTLRTYLGTLDTVTRVVRVVGFINCAPGFNTPSEVLHGFSDLMVDIFGEAGRHTRSAIGVAELYADIPVEVEATFQVTETS